MSLDREAEMTQDLRRLWRLIKAFGKVRQGMLQKKDVKKIRAKPVCV
jgi:hypothetical protein